MNECSLSLVTCVGELGVVIGEEAQGSCRFGLVAVGENKLRLAARSPLDECFFFLETENVYQDAEKVAGTYRHLENDDCRRGDGQALLTRSHLKQPTTVYVCSCLTWEENDAY